MPKKDEAEYRRDVEELADKMTAIGGLAGHLQRSCTRSLREMSRALNLACGRSTGKIWSGLCWSSGT